MLKPKICLAGILRDKFHQNEELFLPNIERFSDGQEAFIILLAQISQKAAALTHQFEQTTAG